MVIIIKTYVRDYLSYKRFNELVDSVIDEWSHMQQDTHAGNLGISIQTGEFVWFDS